MFIEISNDFFLKKDSIISVSRDIVPRDDLVNGGKPCVLVRFTNGSESCSYRCFSSDINNVNHHFKWLISLFEITELPDSNPFSK